MVVAMNRLYGWAALLGFFVVVVVHIATAYSLDVYPYFRLLCCSILELFFCWVSACCLPVAGIRISTKSWSTPFWCVLLAVIFGYAILNMFLRKTFTDGAGADLVGGQYVLQDMDTF